MKTPIRSEKIPASRSLRMASRSSSSRRSPEASPTVPSAHASILLDRKEARLHPVHDVVERIRRVVGPVHDLALDALEAR